MHILCIVVVFFLNCYDQRTRENYAATNAAVLHKERCHNKKEEREFFYFFMHLENCLA